MNNSFIERTPAQQKRVYEKLSLKLSEIGLDLFSLERRRFEEKALGLTPPTRKRQKETEDCVGWRKYYQGGYFIEVLPTFNEQKGLFSKEGIASVLIKTPSKKKGFRKCFEMYFNRKDGMVERIEKIVYFLDRVLQNRPYQENGRLFELYRSNESDFVFLSGDRKKKIFILDNSITKLFNKRRVRRIREIFKTREVYHQNKPPKTRSIRTIKKKRKVTTPENVVPKMR